MYAIRPLPALLDAFLLVLVLVAAVLVFRAVTRIRVGTHFDRARRFAGYHRYTQRSAALRNAPNSLTVLRVRNAVDRSLQSKGYVEVEDPAEADLEVQFRIGTGAHSDTGRCPRPRVPRRLSRMPDSPCPRPEALRIDLFDARNHEPVWSGWTRRAMLDENMARDSEAIDKTVTAVLARFPPH